MIFQSKNYYRISVVCGIAIISALVIFQNFSSCPARQFSLIDEIVRYQDTMDYSMCVPLDEKIQLFNAQCNSNLEVLECR
ncbi:MAG: hypothetical protein EB150_02275 [Nitrososphaeria archaeon]|nr:hypothetical protein [Nitrososphaeria archaeon]NDB50786.1 hypothetical protein [Nitrosopumilaceae archaeon]NDB87501.1 hypothetical protein [Nitrososphaerota archaeon]NDB45951.1 hypothetical protein [Nitrososphaeria archaeon]NDB89439.1 hypothetical protein [Nitrososphaerota archaeon]